MREVRYRIHYERTPTNYGAWSPDLWGCVAVGDTLEECRISMREAVVMHLAGLAEDGDVRPQPSGYLEILDFEPETSARTEAEGRSRSARSAAKSGRRAKTPTVS